MDEWERAGYPGGLELEAGWDETEDITALTGSELSGRLEELVREERSISYWRRVLHARIDLIRAELVRRGSVGASPEELAYVLAPRLAPAFSRYAEGSL